MGLVLLLMAGLPLAAIGFGLQRVHEGLGLAVVLLSGLVAGYLGVRPPSRLTFPSAAALLLAACAALVVLAVSIELVQDGWAAACANPDGPVCLDDTLRVAGIFPVLFGALASGSALMLLGWLALRQRRS